MLNNFAMTTKFVKSFSVCTYFVLCMFFFSFFFFLEPSLLTPTPLQELKKEKSYFKMLVKRDKDLEMLKRKHEKVRIL